MTLITRQGKGSKLTIVEMDNNLVYLEQSSIVLDYPTTTPSSAGEKFWYNGNEWHYMTQPQINSTGWEDLVNVGFPAPISKKLDKNIYFSGGSFTVAYDGNLSLSSTSSYVDFIGLGKPDKVSLILADSGRTSLMPYNLTILGFRNAALLSSLEDIGTTVALRFVNNGLTAEIIDDLFTQLPTTTKTATINVNGNPGANTCDTSIATGKGYTVVT